MSTLTLVRHLAPLVDKSVCYGRTDLTVDPAVMAAALPALRARLPANTKVYSSPLRRCSGLAAALSDAVTIDARLTELDFGAWEMRRWDDIARAEIDAWAEDVVHYRPGGGESVAAMAARVGDFFTALPLDPAVVICHAGTIRLLSACLRGLDPHAMARAAAAAPNPIAYGEIVTIERV